MNIGKINARQKIEPFKISVARALTEIITAYENCFSQFNKECPTFRIFYSEFRAKSHKPCQCDNAAEPKI